MDTKTFQRRIENFSCEYCGTYVDGSGYTNHCPECFWSKHVDVNPGDRAATCGGLMEPREITANTRGYTVMQVCTSCGHRRNNKLNTCDNIATAIAITRQQSHRA